MSFNYRNLPDVFKYTDTFRIFHLGRKKCDAPVVGFQTESNALLGKGELLNLSRPCLHLEYDGTSYYAWIQGRAMEMLLLELSIQGLNKIINSSIIHFKYLVETLIHPGHKHWHSLFSSWVCKLHSKKESNYEFFKCQLILGMKSRIQNPVGS